MERKEIAQIAVAAIVGSIVTIGTMTGFDNSDAKIANKQIEVDGLKTTVSDLKLALAVEEAEVVDYSDYTLTADIPVAEEVEAQEYSDAEYAELMGAFDFLAEYPEYSEAVFDDLDDDEGYLIPARVEKIKNSLDVVVEYLKDEFADELDKETVDGILIDEDDVEKHKIYGDLDEAELTDWDWDDNEFTWKVENKFDHDDDEDLKVFAIVDVEENEVEDLDFEDVE